MGKVDWQAIDRLKSRVRRQTRNWGGQDERTARALWSYIWHAIDEWAKAEAERR